MKHKITAKKQFRLLGCVFYGNPFHSAKGWDVENEIGKLWTRFNKIMDENKDKLIDYVVNPDISYEVHIDPVVAKEEGKWYVFTGVEVKDLSEIPLELFSKILPKTKYVVFTTKGKEYLQANDFIYKEWLPKSGYEESYPFQIQVYDSNRYKGLDDEETEIDFYIPIK